MINKDGISITPSSGYVIHSNSGRVNYATNAFNAEKYARYAKKEDRKDGIIGSEITLSIILDGYLVKSDKSGFEAFVPTMDLAKKKAKYFAEKELKKESVEKISEGSLESRIGERMRYARETLNGMAQGRAADLLRIHQKKLCQYEHYTDKLIPPLDVLIKCAKLYDVSLDYLTLISDDFEQNAKTKQEKGVSSWIYDQLELNTIAQLNSMRVIHDKIMVLGELAGFIIETSKELNATMADVIEKNPKNWQYVRLGNKLQNLVNKQSAEADTLRAKLTRINLLSHVAKKTTGLNVDIFNIDGVRR